MRLTLNHLRIIVTSKDDPFVFSLPLKAGLVILRADNSMGKSTAMKSILYALGMDRLLASENGTPTFVPAVSSDISSGQGELFPVVSSRVQLELSNASGEALTLERVIRGQGNRQVVSVYRGPVLTQPGTEATVLQLNASRPRLSSELSDLHAFLAHFLGWQLPVVVSADGRESLLPLECLMPFVYVEQMQGWGSVVPRFPVSIKIKEPAKRGIEFLLGLRSIDPNTKIQKLSSEIRLIQKNWRQTISELRRVAAQRGGVLEIPGEVGEQWPPLTPPRMLKKYEAGWLTLDAETEHLKTRISQIQKVENLPPPGTQEAALESLAKAEELLSSREVRHHELTETRRLESEGVKLTESYLEQLDSDIHRNKEALTLAQLGATIAPGLSSDQCPTCNQPVTDLLTVSLPGPAMPIADNIRYLENIRSTYAGSLEQPRQRAAELERLITQSQDELRESRSEVRRLKKIITGDRATVSTAMIEERVRLQMLLVECQKASAHFDQALQRLDELDHEWRQCQSELRILSGRSIQDADNRKLEALDDSFKKQLAAYGFISLPIEQLHISRNTLLPDDGKHGSDGLPGAMSASDLIRVIWAYMLGLAEVARSEETNHPGLLLLDEPRQQSANLLSFDALLARASLAGEHNQQVILSTSEDRDGLLKALSSLSPDSYTLVDIPGRLLTIQPVTAPHSRS